MRLYCSAKMTGEAGELYSLALVPADDQCEPFYQVLTPRAPLSQWVRENVKPIVRQGAIPRKNMRARLEEYLWRFAVVEIVANSVADVRELLRLVEPGEHPTMSIRIIDRFPHSEPNALSEASALAEWGCAFLAEALL